MKALVVASRVSVHVSVNTARFFVSDLLVDIRFFRLVLQNSTQLYSSIHLHPPTPVLFFQRAQGSDLHDVDV